MKKIEQFINRKIKNIPLLKKIIKRVYQLFFWAISFPKYKYKGNVKKVTPNDGYEYFFGYYDKSPWSKSEKYMLCLRARNTSKSVAPKEKADVILINNEDNTIKVIGTTSTWNNQQGAMLQWLGPDYETKIIYNDYRNNKYCSVIYNLITSEEKVVNAPVYSVSPLGDFGLTLDFSRLHRLRPGYGYSNTKDVTIDNKCPDEPCIWKVTFETGEILPILNYTDFYNFETKESMIDAEHKVNHIMINPDSKRFMVLHRWISTSGKRFTRLVTCDIDGKNMYNLCDEDMISHCCWKDEKQIFGYARKNGKDGYYLFDDLSKIYSHMYDSLYVDGHPSFSPNKKTIVTDTYPDRTRISRVYLLINNKVKEVASFFAPFKYDNDLRCDLHPKWDRVGKKICVDSVCNGKRAIYIIELDEVVDYEKTN